MLVCFSPAGICQLTALKVTHLFLLHCDSCDLAHSILYSLSSRCMLLMFYSLLRMDWEVWVVYSPSFSVVCVYICFYALSTQK